MSILSNKFKALSEDVRLQILALIVLHGELCVCEVERCLEISQSKASRHLRYLMNAGLLQDHRDGLWVYYKLADPDSEADRQFMDSIQALLAGVPVPDVRDELHDMRSDRCGPGSTASIGEGVAAAVKT
ncbi:MAG: metalloregulator ArsR/SmtB family transcription factor [Gemmatimonadota bacterium]